MKNVMITVKPNERVPGDDRNRRVNIATNVGA